MKKNIQLTFAGGKRVISIDEPSECPMCKHSILPQELSQSIYADGNDSWRLASTYLCKNCYQPFIVSHVVEQASLGFEYIGILQYVAPKCNERKSFDPRVDALSPSFVEIYNQALAAESSGLDQIAGIGYRKALEFLIKDYLIHTTPDEEAAIKGALLGTCISKWVQNDNLKAVASRCAWLGNDQTHYVQKFEEYDLADLKRLIETSVYWICMELNTAEALKIEPRGH